MSRLKNVEEPPERPEPPEVPELDFEQRLTNLNDAFSALSSVLGILEQNLKILEEKLEQKADKKHTHKVTKITKYQMT